MNTARRTLFSSTEELNIFLKGVAFMLADMAINCELSRLMTYRSAWEIDQNNPTSYYSSIAKCFSADTANATASNAVQIFGG